MPSTIFKCYSVIMASSSIIPDPTSPLSRLPPEVHIIIGQYLLSKDLLHIRQTSVKFRFHFSEIYRSHILNVFYEGEAQYDCLFSCQFCHMFKPKSSFVDWMTRGEYGKQGAQRGKHDRKPLRRFCLDCTVRERVYRKNTESANYIGGDVPSRWYVGRRKSSIYCCPLEKCLRTLRT
ncbi:hypothetical protein BJ878DRAFT_330426 [Calycina marina]|uniref:F-box domain-containing protein n=1 Tax=Calycina marina TaxID=1763456 RepID=A0A9P8CAY5_9HELO|nr:hypothetical protein BJ878DRAFT_330426 [Calycina marina]